MTRGILYMLTGTKHAAQLVVSLHSLRRHYEGHVCLWVGCEPSKQFAQKCKSDFEPLQIIEWEAPTRARNKAKGLPKVHQQSNKPDMIQWSPFDQTIFLDADTLVAKPIDDLWPRAGTEEVRLTQFADWDTQENHIRRRVESWRELCPAEAARMLGHRYPGLNTGILSFTKLSTAFGKRWKEVTMLKPNFMCDELAAQLIFPQFPHMILDDRWNASATIAWSRHGPAPDYIQWASQHTVLGQPIMSSEKVAKYSKTTGGGAEHVVIWHGHGWKFIKHACGRVVWWPTFAECREKHPWMEDYIQLDGKLNAYLADPSKYA